MVINAVEKDKTGKGAGIDTGGRGGPTEKTREHGLEGGEQMSRVGLGEQPPWQTGAQGWMWAGAWVRPARPEAVEGRRVSHRRGRWRGRQGAVPP